MKVFAVIVALAALTSAGAQSPAGWKPLRIADSLSAKEKLERNPVLLRSELDSLVKLYAPPVIPQEDKPVPEKEGSWSIPLLLTGTGILILLSILNIYLLGRQRRGGPLPGITEEQPTGAVEAVKKGKKAALPEERIRQLQTELALLSKEKERLQKQAGEYNGIQQDYDELKHSLEKTFKIRYYPGIKPGKNGTVSILSVLETEKAMTAHAFENFLKPLLVLTDANKNNPARLSKADQEKMIELLVSLSFLFIEYLYLRVGDLSVGGSIVERLGSVASGAGIPQGQLKKLNTESGSRALVMRMVLDKASVGRLSYPVFDETNLNKS